MARSPLPMCLAWALLAGAAAGCGGAPVKRYYTLENAAEAAPEAHAAPPCDRQLVVASVDVAPPYASDKIAFRSGTLEIRYYNYRYWVSAPEEMLRALVSRRLAAAGLFAAVESPDNGSRDRLELQVDVIALEEVDRGEAWTARLALGLALKDDRSGTVLWRHELDRTRNVMENEVGKVVEALNAIYNDEMQEMIALLKRYLIARGCRPTE